MDEDYLQKNTLTASVSAKINAGNYQSRDFFISRTVIMPNDSDILDYYHTREDIYSQLAAEVELEAATTLRLLKESEGWEDDSEAYEKVLASTREWKAASIEDFQKLSPYHAYLINEEKKRVKRSPEYKARKTTSNVENEANRAR